MGTHGSGKSTRNAPSDWPSERGTDLGTAMPSYWPERLTEAVVAEARGERGAARGAELEPAWERWFERAVDQGVDEELAGLGRALMREASEGGWLHDQAEEAGLLDDGEGLLELALDDPEHAQARWRELLEGER